MDSFDQLVAIIDAWAFAKQVESFFNTAAQDAAVLGEEERTLVLGRLEQAREMFGGVAPLTHFRTWKNPDER